MILQVPWSRFDISSQWEMMSEFLVFSTNDKPSAWVSFKGPRGKDVLIGYVDLNIDPSVIACDDVVLVGAGIDVFCVSSDESLLFKYQMPTVFYEFLCHQGTIIIHDELGFVILDKEGGEFWSAFVSGPISNYIIAGNCISGETIDGELFTFKLP